MNELIRLLSKIDISTEDACWNWKGGDSGQGYGRFSFQKKREMAHRAAYRLLVGPIPDGKVIHHTCRSKMCCNPNHLEAVSPEAHPLLDLTIVQANCQKTHCLRGHEFVPENTYVPPKGGRCCRTCQRERYHLNKPPVRIKLSEEERAQRRKESQKRAYHKTHPNAAGRTGRPRGEHCPHGHPYIEPNIRRNDKGHVFCLACEKIRAKARSQGGLAFKDRTHCPQGHAYDEANTRHGTDGARHCRACQRDIARRRREKQKSSP